LVLGVLLLPAWTQADTLTNAMNAVTVRVLCLTPNGNIGTGSGFSIAGGTHIVTNWHVVSCTKNRGKVGVLLNANTQEVVAAEVREWDEAKDLAVLRLERRIARPDARFATLSTLEQRDPVVAVGFPGDADEMGGATALSAATLTEGVVGRLLPDGNSTAPPLVQVSAAINPGNSGGPLFDEAGRVVGINTIKSLAAVPAIDTDGGITMQRVVLGEGLGWAVASDAVLPLLNRLGLHYEVSHRRLLAPERWWYREPVLVSALVLLGLVMIAILSQLATRSGRARVQEGLTRAIRREPSGARPASSPSPPPVATPPVGQPLLHCLNGPYAGQSIPLSGRPVAIGRDPALVQLVLPPSQSAISQRHALVGHDPVRGTFSLEDCWSTNGVFLLHGPDGGKGRGTRLRAGQVQSLPAGARFYLATPDNTFEVNYQ
jgi:hypothetical protein